MSKYPQQKKPSISVCGVHRSLACRMSERKGVLRELIGMEISIDWDEYVVMIKGIALDPCNPNARHRYEMPIPIRRVFQAVMNGPHPRHRMDPTCRGKGKAEMTWIRCPTQRSTDTRYESPICDVTASIIDDMLVVDGVGPPFYPSQRGQRLYTLRIPIRDVREVVSEFFHHAMQRLIPSPHLTEAERNTIEDRVDNDPGTETFIRSP